MKTLLPAVTILLLLVLGVGVYVFLSLDITTKDVIQPETGAPTPSQSTRHPAVPPDRVDMAGAPTVAEEEAPAVGDSPETKLPLKVFHEEKILAWHEAHPNGPHLWIPSRARDEDLAFYEKEAIEILGDWERQRDALLARHGDNLLAFSADPDVLQNDKDRQRRLKDLVLSIWPDCGPKG